VASIKRTIKYDSERDNDFAEEIKAMPGFRTRPLHPVWDLFRNVSTQYLHGLNST